MNKQLIYLKFSLLFFLTNPLQIFSQQSKWNGTYIYNVKLPNELNNEPGIYINILYNNGPLVSSDIMIGGKKVKLASEFTYHEEETKVINNVILPINLPSKTYSWLLNEEILTEIKKFPTLYSFLVFPTGKPIVGFDLPKQFYFKVENAAEVSFYQTESKKKTNPNELFQSVNNVLDIPLKDSKKQPSLNQNNLILSFSISQDGFPIWFTKVFPNFEPENKYTKDREIVKFIGYLYKNKIFIEAKPEKNIFPMLCYKKYLLSDLEGNTCRGQIGAGSFATGHCNEILKSKKINIEVQINP